jgi:hypothetical protein
MTAILCYDSFIGWLISCYLSLVMAQVPSPHGIGGHRIIGVDDRGCRVRFLAGLGIFLFTTASRTALGPTQPPIQSVPWVFSVRVKRPGREADHSPPSSAEVKNAWSYTSTPQYVFVAWCLVKHRDNFTFYLYL